MIELQKGEKRKLADLLPGQVLRVQIVHDLAGADLSVFGLNAERKLQDDRYFVFYNQPQSPGGEIKAQLNDQGAVFDLNLAALPPQVQRLVLTITHDQAALSQLGQLRLGVCDPQGSEKAAINLVGSVFGPEKALMIAELYLHNGEWRLTNVAQGFQGGLESLLTYFGGETTGPENTASSTVANPPPAHPAAQESYVPAPSAPLSPVPVPPVPVPPIPQPSGMGSSVADFLRQSAEQDRPGEVFELESSKMLEAKVNGRIWSKLGAMVAYRGRLTFNRASTLGDMLGGMRGGGGGLVGSLVNAAVRMGSQEMGPLVAIEGQGVCYLADQGKEIAILRLQGDALNVSGNDLLAFEDTVQHHITMQRSVAGMVAGGLFSVRMQGHGLVAILSHGKPLTLRVTPHEPIFTDPNATIAWSEHLQPELKVNQDLRSFIGRGGGETLQMMFRGDGFVVVQPYEESASMSNIPKH